MIFALLSDSTLDLTLLPTIQHVLYLCIYVYPFLEPCKFDIVELYINTKGCIFTVQ